MKKILLSLIIIGFVASASAQSLQNFEYGPSEEEYPVDLTGGESFTQAINFTSEADRELPFGVRVTVENDTTNFETSKENLGAEFELTGTLTDSRPERDLVFKERLSDGNLVYIGSIDAENDSLGPQSENSLEIKVEANQAIRPDSFNFEFDVRSAPGFAAETNTTEVDETTGQAEVKVGQSSVSVKTQSGKNVTVESYNETTVSPPDEGSSFVGGVGVEVRDDNGNDAEANGTVSIGYSQSVIDERGLDEDSMTVYFYNESSGEWTSNGIEVIRRDTAENVVTANVSHFSTYAAFASEEQEDDSSGSGGGFEYGTTSSTNQEETQDDTTENDTVVSSQDNNQTETGGQEETQTQNETAETGSETPEEAGEAQRSTTPQSPVGQFMSSETNVAGGIIVLLVAFLAFLQYTGRVELREFEEVVRQKISR